MLLDPRAERAHPPFLLGLRHRQRLVQHAGELVHRERVDVHRLAQLARRAGEARQDQHAPQIRPRRDELLRDQVHAVVQRRDDTDVRRPIERGDVLRRRGAAAGRSPASSLDAEALVDAP